MRGKHGVQRIPGPVERESPRQEEVRVQVPAKCRAPTESKAFKRSESRKWQLEWERRTPPHPVHQKRPRNRGQKAQKEGEGTTLPPKNKKESLPQKSPCLKRVLEMYFFIRVYFENAPRPRRWEKKKRTDTKCRSFPASA